MLRLRSFAIASFVLAGACSLTTSLDGLTGGTTSGDGGIDASSADTGTDSPVTKDSGRDGGVEVDAATTSPCAEGHTFCADFDESTTVPTYDAVDDVDDNLSIDSTTSVSHPSSLLAILPSGGNTARVTKYLTTGTQAKIDFDLMIESSQGNAILLELFTPYASDSANHFFYIETYDDNIQFTEALSPADGGDTQFTGTQLGAMTEGVWTHIELTIDGNSGNVSSALGASTESHTMVETFPNGSFYMLWGQYPNSGSPSLQAHYDNVVVDIQ